MDHTPALYVMLTQTGTGMGKLIRLLTHYEFNHVSVSLDPTFRNWVSFARYVRGVPLAGGFVKETPQRLLSAEGPLPVRILRVDLSDELYQEAARLVANAEQQAPLLIYNTLDALATVIGCRFPLPGVYTCLGFAELLLDKQYATIRMLNEDLKDSMVYEGNLKELLGGTTPGDDPYFVKRGILGGTRDTLVHFARLIGRFLHRSSYEDPLIVQSP